MTSRIFLTVLLSLPLFFSTAVAEDFSYDAISKRNSETRLDARSVQDAKMQGECLVGLKELNFQKRDDFDPVAEWTNYRAISLLEQFPPCTVLIMIEVARKELTTDVVQKSVTDIEVNAAKDFVAQREDAIILDVRTPVEYEISHITGSVNVNVQDESFEDMIVTLDRNKTYIVHCTRNPLDGRSQRALNTLKSLGFKHLYSLEGGYVAWQDANLPLTDRSN